MLTPTAEGEIWTPSSRTVCSGKWDCEVAKETYGAYMVYYAALVAKGADLPQRCLRAEYADEYGCCVSFSPWVVTVINRKTATANFT